MPLNNEAINLIEEKIGYVFKDKALLSRAFTHTSAQSDNRKNYQTLEFLGDSIVDFVIAEELMKRYPTVGEGTLTKMRASLVSEEPLSQVIDRLRISEFMLLGIGERRNKIYAHSSVMCDLFESICGAIYYDGGMGKATEFVLKSLAELLDAAECGDDNSDSKSLLNEYAAKHSLSVKYVQKGQSGPAHKPVFSFSVELDGKAVGEGKGATKQDAQQDAAKHALSSLSLDAKNQ